MSITRLILVFFFSVAPVVSGYSQSAIEKDTTDLAVLILKLKYNLGGSVGLGGYLMIQNIESKKIYANKAKFGMSTYAVLTDIPTGTYKVLRVEFHTDLPYNILFSCDHILYDTLHITEPKAYYIGSYLAFPTRPFTSINYKIRKYKDDSEKKIMKQINKRIDEPVSVVLDRSQTLFKEEELLIHIPKK